MSVSRLDAIGRGGLPRWFLVWCCALAASGGSGCQPRSSAIAPSQPPVIPVSRPVARQITDHVYYTGRADAVQTVEIRARATGYLVKMPFKEGSEVKQGDLLFEVDPRPYQAQYDASKAQVDVKEAAYRLAKAETARSVAINRNVSGAISPENLEKNQAQEAQGLAELNVAKATLSLAKLDLDFTQVTAPIDGHIGRYNYTVGNLITQDQTLLTTIVSVDPMYAFFDVDERTVVRVRRAINEGKIKSAGEPNEIPVFMGLEGEEAYPNPGKINFFNNTVNMNTGTITGRGVFANAKPDGGRRLLTPGMFLRIQLPIGQPHPALLVVDRAVGSDQGVKYVDVVDAENKVQYRKVTLGDLQEDGLRVIENGLKPDDWVVIGGLQQVEPGMKIEPERSTMPSLLTPPEPAAAPASAGAPAPKSAVPKTQN